MKLKNARVGATVGTYAFVPSTSDKKENHMVYGQILEVFPNGVLIRWDDIGDITHFEPDLRSMFLARKY